MLKENLRDFLARRSEIDSEDKKPKNYKDDPLFQSKQKVMKLDYTP